MVRTLLCPLPGAAPRHKAPAMVLLYGSVGDIEERGHRYGLSLAGPG